MAYERTRWVAYETPVSAARLNNLEEGILANEAAISSAEQAVNKVTTLSAASTDAQYPSAAAVWALFHSIADGNEVSY